MIAGISLALAGLMISFLHRLPGLPRLPGDIVIQKKNLTVYLPFATSLAVSVILSLIFWLWPRR